MRRQIVKSNRNLRGIGGAAEQQGAREGKQEMDGMRMFGNAPDYMREAHGVYFAESVRRNRYMIFTGPRSSFIA